MPKIGVRIGDAGGGDFSGLYGAQGRGLASGLGAGLGFAQQMGEMQTAQDERARQEQARQFYAGEFARLGGDPDQMEAFTALDPRIQAAEVDRLQKARVTARKMKGLAENLQWLSSNPLTEEGAQGLLARADAGEDPLKLMAEADELKKGLRMYREGISRAQMLAQRFANTFQAEVAGGMPPNQERQDLMEMLMARIQQAESDPALEYAINEEDIAGWESEWRKAGLTAADLEELENEAIEKMLMAQREAILRGFPTKEDGRMNEKLTGMGAKRTGVRSWAFDEPGGAEKARTAAQEKGGMPAQAEQPTKTESGRVIHTKPAPAAAVSAAVKKIQSIISSQGESTESIRQIAEIARGLKLTPEQFDAALNQARNPAAASQTFGGKLPESSTGIPVQQKRPY